MPPMIDPLLSLAISMQANPGMYALLLGSGTSRSASIPTGWEMVLDLAETLARLQGEDAGLDPESWYRTKYARDPDYGELINAIGRTATERQQILRSYFEPNDSDREQGLKLPTEAHRAIAKLIRDGFCRVVVTTNFDRLLETALEAEGVIPTVIASADALDGALPLVHQRCCIIKLHGDYLDSRIRNTTDELASYDPRMDRVLDQVLDQFGLIICGWSAQWDLALRSAIERSPTRRFTVYWAVRESLTLEAERLATLRSAVTVQIKDADAFFSRLYDMVSSLTESRRDHPLSIRAAVALVKRYLVRPEHRIQLDDLVANEAERTHKQLDECWRELERMGQKPDKIRVAYQNFGELIARLQAMCITGAAQGSTESDSVFLSAIARICAYHRKGGGVVLNEGLTQYPALVLYYSLGLAALARNRIGFLARLFNEPQWRGLRKKEQLLVAFDYGELQRFAQVTQDEKKFVPMSEHLFEAMSEPLSPILADANEYDEVFDRFEYLRALAFADASYSDVTQEGRYWVPLGRYCWKARRSDHSIIQVIDEELERKKQDWPYLQFGLFGGSIDRVCAVKKVVDQFVSNLPFH